MLKKNTVPEYLHVLVYIYMYYLTCETYYLGQNLIYFAAEKKNTIQFFPCKIFF